MTKAPRTLANTGLATRLVIALVVLIILTTLSAGVPAFLLARRQLETQAWAQVDATRRATESLYDAALSRVVDLTALLAERPTLRRLMADNDPAALQSYLLAFREQSDLDFIQICDESGAFVAVGAPVDLCAAVDDALDAGVVFIEERPVLLARRVIRGDDGPKELGVVVAGVRLDGEFLAQLSANTGVDQSILAGDGGAIVSTLPAGPITAELAPEGWVIRAGGMPFFAAQFPLPGQGSRLYAEVAVPVATLIETERVALTILVAGSALVALAGGIIGAWFIRRLTAPLSVLTHTAEQISAGQLSATIPRFGQPPEVATLSAALERSQATMLEALVERSQARDWLIALIQSVVEGVITFDCLLYTSRCV